MADKQEVFEKSNGDLEKAGKAHSIVSTLSTDSTDQKLRILGEKNPHYVHNLTWTEEEEKRIVRIFDFKVLTWIFVMCKEYDPCCASSLCGTLLVLQPLFDSSSSSNV